MRSIHLGKGLAQIFLSFLVFVLPGAVPVVQPVGGRRDQVRILGSRVLPADMPQLLTPRWNMFLKARVRKNS